MTTEHIEEVSGVGDLMRHGQAIQRVRYRLAVYQPTLGPGGLPIPFLRRVEGAIDVDGHELPAELVGAELALRLDDGRRLGIRLTDEEGRFESCQHGAHGACGCC